MLSFDSPKIEDVEWIRPIVAQAGCMGCEFAPAIMYLWEEKYKKQICRYEDFYIIKGSRDFSYPVGNGELKEVLQAMLDYAKEQAMPFSVFGVTPKGIHDIEVAMPGVFSFVPQRAEWDYIYSVKNMVELKGKPFHSKRNHIAKFKRLYSYEYEDISFENAAECLQMAEEWRSRNSTGANAGEYEDELKAIARALSSFQPLGLAGGLIRVEGRPVAFTIGEELNPDLFVIHFEKANTEFDGAYAVMNHEFARRRLLCYKYINREEDLGIPGLRKAKLSYHPVLLLEKYTAVPAAARKAAGKK